MHTTHVSLPVGVELVSVAGVGAGDLQRVQHGRVKAIYMMERRSMAGCGRSGRQEMWEGMEMNVLSEGQRQGPLAPSHRRRVRRASGGVAVGLHVTDPPPPLLAECPTLTQVVGVASV